MLRERLADRDTEIRDQLAEMRTPKFDARGEASLADLNFRSAMREAFNQRRGQFTRAFGGNFSGRMLNQFTRWHLAHPQFEHLRLSL